jgi:hypothetical protein
MMDSLTRSDGTGQLKSLSVSYPATLLSFRLTQIKSVLG